MCEEKITLLIPTIYTRAPAYADLNKYHNITIEGTKH